jgi:CSLREA domain-containing protein
MDIQAIRKVAGVAILSAFTGLPLAAATFVVDTTVDAVDANIGDHACRTAADTCSLRAAVQEANALPGLDEVLLPAGTFALSLTGVGEDLAVTGDLDVEDDLTLTGAGEDSTVLDAAGLDRLFDSHPGAGGMTLWLTELTVQGGAPPFVDGDGGCFRNPEGGQLLLGAATVRACRGLRQGGAIFNGGRFEGVDVSLLDNGDPSLDFGQGGAVANIGPAAQVYLLTSELRGNRASNGGAIYTSAEFVTPHSSEVRIEQCSLVDNQVRQSGGAILNNSRTEVYLQDSTLSRNLASSGGALFNDGGGFFRIRNSTITGNHASNIGGGISEVHFNAQFIVSRNSIIAGNTADFRGPDCNFRMRSEGGTLLGSTNECEMAAGAGDILNTDPQLGPLVRLGRRTWSHLLRAGSPAIDAGAAVLCTPTDQLGTARPLDGNLDGQAFCDLGAIEMGGELFLSGFETGDLSEWSAASP